MEKGLDSLSESPKNNDCQQLGDKRSLHGYPISFVLSPAVCYKVRLVWTTMAFLSSYLIRDVPICYLSTKCVLL